MYTRKMLNLSKKYACLVPGHVGLQNACTQALFDLLALCLQGSLQRTRLEFPAKAVPLSQFQIILLRSHSMPKSKQDYKKKQVVSNVFLHFWRVTSPSKLISWWQSLEAPGSPVLQDFAVDPLLPQETQTQEALEDPFRGVRANKPGRPANTMTWCTAKSSPPPINPCFFLSTSYNEGFIEP